MEAKKGEVGIGTLIVFISMILVAAIAAAVFITTTSSLQDTALATGTQAKGEISTSLQIVEVRGGGGDTASDIDNLTITARLASGSDSINLENALVTFSLVNLTMDLEYQNNTNFSDAGNYTNFFDVGYPVQGVEWNPGFIARGDLVQFYVRPTRAITTSEELRFSFTPKVGVATVRQMTAPESISRNTITLFP